MYFALVFGAGFMLGPMRILCIAPRLGERTAELLEAPVMLAISILTARWVVRRLRVPCATRIRLGMYAAPATGLDPQNTGVSIRGAWLICGHASSGGTKVKAPGITGL